MSTYLTLACKAVLFDMDGTLVDSNRVVQSAWAWWSARHALPPEAVLAFSHGRPTIATMDHFLPGRDHSADLQEMARYEETQVEGILAVPGAVEVVRALGHHPWAIVTSAWKSLAQARVSAAGFPIPRVIVAVDEIRRGKPHPEGYLRAAELLGVRPADCLVFEDTPAGIEAGVAAGMQVVGLLTTLPADRLPHRPLIRDFRDVTIQPHGELLKIGLRLATPLL